MLALGLIGLLACGESPTETPASAPAPAPAPAPVEAAKAEEPAQEIERRGKVLESMDVDTYTYARLDYCGQEAWVAGPKTVLEEGQIVKMTGGMAMTDFESESLGRTFDAILFVQTLEPTDEAEIACPEIKGHATAAQPAKPAKEEEEPQFHGKVLEQMMSGGYTYARLDVCGTEYWLAGPKSFLREGHWVQVAEAAEMKNFSSGTLDRTFASLWFVPRYKIVAEGPECE